MNYLYLPCHDQNHPESAQDEKKGSMDAEYKKLSDVACIMLGNMSPALLRLFVIMPPQNMMAVLRKMFEETSAVEFFDLVLMVLHCHMYGHWKWNLALYLEELRANKKKSEHSAAGLDEDIIWKQPEGYVDPKFQTGVCKLQGPLWFEAASRQWNKTCTRPDVEFAQILVSRYSNSNTGEAPAGLLCYKVSDGYVFVVNGGAVDWKSKKQTTIAMHATQSVYMAASESCKGKAVWVRSLSRGKVIEHANGIGLRLLVVSAYL
ncbi:hypothetical protein Tco_0589187 [Tanacetum coccineum]